MQDTKRATGRTTRMLFDAAKATLNCTQENDRVYIIVHDANFQDYVLHELAKLFSKVVCSKIVVLPKKHHLVRRTACNQYKGVAAIYNDKGTFVDHHVWYEDVVEAYQIIAEYAKYDA